MRFWILESNNPVCQYRLRADLLESSFEEKDLGFLVYNNLSQNQKYPWGQEGQQYAKVY